MAEQFYGSWRIDVIELESAFDLRVVVAGSDASDGVVAGKVGESVTVDGEAWTVEMQWNDRQGSGWQPCDVRRKSTYTNTDGLTAILEAEDNVPDLRDGDWNDLVVRCSYLESEISPPPTGNPISFTVPD